ncbi:ARM repeat superfamily protein [Actinidia rufa]|uniref:ARM repeat superfamily protein n=1 Tax=Actinidia rufa TaxID=165716 RepID=A0A7J0GEW1_9ERIC|nr:ARM repeat superfamily protein [Actinidia rufa]
MMIINFYVLLGGGAGLADHDNYHEFCRLVGRFKVNYQLSELVNMEGYSSWISLVTEFTLKSLQSWQWASSGVYYLLGLWSRLVTSVPYLKGNSPNLLNEFVPKIIEQFISSKFDSIQAGLSDDLSEDPLDNVELLQDQLECIPYLCRFQYESCSTFIMQITDPILQMYMEAVNLPALADNSELVIIEAKLAWVAHIIAAILKTRQLVGLSADSHEIQDAELSARVLRLINVIDSGLHSQRYGEVPKQRLDRAVLIFFQYFRKSYIGDQAMHSSKQLYARLSELLGLHDHLLILNVIVGKIATNLKCYAESEEVINQTLGLFSEMATGFMTGKLLLKLDTVQYIISHHNNGFAPKVFVSLESTPDAIFRTDSVKYALIGLMRDLRGIAMATNSRRTYGFLFDWLYPTHMPLLLKAITHWTDTPEVTTPLLKFMAEFVLNKSQRLTFDSSSPNGILLFREVSKLTVAYGSRILSLPNCADLYTFKYKGIWILLSVLARALAGNYVNFGVFELYGDRALSDALDTVLKLLISIPLVDILAYRKLTAAYFAFLEVLLNSHIAFVLNLDTSTFRHIVGSLESGLRGVDTNILSQCASAVDNLATFYFNNITVGESPTTPAALNLARHVADCPGVFPEILKTLFEIVLFEDCGNQWSLSRPMLSLILISEEMFTNLRAQILASQPVDQQPRLSLCFDHLMADITQSLETKNRDKFTQNLTKFRNDFRSR